MSNTVLTNGMAEEITASLPTSTRRFAGDIMSAMLDVCTGQVQTECPAYSTAAEFAAYQTTVAATLGYLAARDSQADHDARDGVLPRNPLAELLAFGAPICPIVETEHDPNICGQCAEDANR